VAEHRFIPHRYFNTIGSHEPMLAVDSGDTVVVTTVDAWGQDEQSRRVTEGPNPTSGPYFVRGAERGDTLAVRIDRITPNRRMGWVRTPLAYNVVDPDYVRDIPDRENSLGEFDVDMTSGLARLTTPVARLAGLALPVQPMIGCFGVAPDGGEAISTATSGPYGGNMDYNGFGAGATAYFPVSVPGALFHLGDVHARQGDGEISGTGIEISAEVAFTVTVLKGRSIGTVRGEDDTHIFTVGNARPLDQAMQHATTEMARWLAADYGLDGHAVGVLMGQCVRYDLGNMFDPAYTMVCRMPKSVLASLNRAANSDGK
jgi:acetamidase/formamidase